jgi:hypothetical protein
MSMLGVQLAVDIRNSNSKCATKLAETLLLLLLLLLQSMTGVLTIDSLGGDFPMLAGK